MRSTTRLVIVLVATVAVAVAGWQVRPGPGFEQPGAALETGPAGAEPGPAGTEPRATGAAGDELSKHEPADKVDSQGGAGSNQQPGVEPASPAAGYISAAPLGIEINDHDEVRAEPQSAEALDCRAYIGEEIRREEAGLIDWEALDTYVELSEDDYANLDVEFVPFDEAILADGERPNFAVMGGPVDVGLLEISRLLAVTDRCWELGVYEEISESIYDEIYQDE